MPNFDALRSAIIGPLEYLCKRQPPAELLGLWTLQGSLNDLSRYGRNLAGSPSYTNTDPIYSNGFTFALNAISLQDFSFDFLVQSGNYRPTSQWIYTNIWSFGVENYYGDCLTFIDEEGTKLAGPVYGYTHIAVARKSGTVRFYKDGNKLASFESATPLTSINMNFGSSGGKICNLRITSKGLGNASSFPVPQTLYTGYEVL